MSTIWYCPRSSYEGYKEGRRYVRTRRYSHSVRRTIHLEGLACVAGQGSLDPSRSQGETHTHKHAHTRHAHALHYAARTHQGGKKSKPDHSSRKWPRRRRRRRRRSRTGLTILPTNLTGSIRYPPLQHHVQIPTHRVRTLLLHIMLLLAPPPPTTPPPSKS